MRSASLVVVLPALPVTATIWRPAAGAGGDRQLGQCFERIGHHDEPVASHVRRA